MRFMQVTCSHCGARYNVNPDKTGQGRVKFRCSKCNETTLLDVVGETARTPAAAAPPVPSAAVAAAPKSPTASGSNPQMDRTMVNEFSGLSLPKDKVITISAIGGPARGMKHEMTKPRVTFGRAGGGADIEIDDQEISRHHCKVEVKDDVVRLYDLKSTNGTFVNDEKVPTAELEHLSEFRIGASQFLVTIMARQD